MIESPFKLQCDQHIGIGAGGACHSAVERERDVHVVIQFTPYSIDHTVVNRVVSRPAKAAAAARSLGYCGVEVGAGGG